MAFTGGAPWVQIWLPPKSGDNGQASGSEKVCKTGKIPPGQIQILWTFLVRNNVLENGIQSIDMFSLKSHGQVDTCPWTVLQGQV